MVKWWWQKPRRPLQVRVSVAPAAPIMKVIILALFLVAVKPRAFTVTMVLIWQVTLEHLFSRRLQERLSLPKISVGTVVKEITLSSVMLMARKLFTAT